MFTITIKRTGRELKDMFGEFDVMDDDTNYTMKYSTKNYDEFKGVLRRVFGQ